MKKYKNYVSLFLVTLLAFSAAACGPAPDETLYPVDSAPPATIAPTAAVAPTPAVLDPTASALSPDVKATIGVCIYKYDDTYTSSVRQAIESASKAFRNVELLMNDAGGNQATQNGQIDDLIKKGVDALAVNIVDINAASTVIEKAKAANLPVVFFDREPDEAVIASYDKARFIGTKPEDAGMIQGLMISGIWEADSSLDKNSDGKIQFVTLTSEPDNSNGVSITNISMSILGVNGIFAEKLGEQACDGDVGKAETAMSAWLSKEGDKIEFIVSDSDDMASGAIAALQANGYNKGDGGKYIPIVGVGETDEAVGLIEKGYMSGTVKKDAVGMGNAVFSIVLNSAAGQDFLFSTSYDYDTTGKAIRIPYQFTN